MCSVGKVSCVDVVDKAEIFAIILLCLENLTNHPVTLFTARVFVSKLFETFFAGFYRHWF